MSTNNREGHFETFRTTKGNPDLNACMHVTFWRKHRISELFWPSEGGRVRACPSAEWPPFRDRRCAVCWLEPGAVCARCRRAWRWRRLASLLLAVSTAQRSSDLIGIAHSHESSPEQLTFFLQRAARWACVECVSHEPTRRGLA